MQGPKLAGRQGGILFELLGEGEAVRIACPCGDLLYGQIVLQEKFLGVVQTLLYEVGVGRDLEFLAEQLKSEKGEEPTVGELAERMGIDPETLVEALDSSREVESIFKTVCGNDGSTVYLIDRLSGGDMEDIADGITLRQMISDLEPKERQLIFLRYFKDRTQSETAKEIGLSQVQVSRMEKKIINRLRDSFGT